MSPNYQSLLPQLWYKMKTPYVVIYRTVWYESSARIHIYTDQELPHIWQYLRHLRQQDKIIDLMLIELNLLQSSQKLKSNDVENKWISITIPFYPN